MSAASSSNSVPAPTSALAPAKRGYKNREATQRSPRFCITLIRAALKPSEFMALDFPKHSKHTDHTHTHTHESMSTGSVLAFSRRLQELIDRGGCVPPLLPKRLKVGESVHFPPCVFLDLVVRLADEAHERDAQSLADDHGLRRFGDGGCRMPSSPFCRKGARWHTVKPKTMKSGLRRRQETKYL